MMKNKLLSILFTILLLASIISLLPASVAADLTVSPGDNIQTAINGIEDGGTIYFEPGTYTNQDILINGAILQKSFSLVSIAGPEMTILDGAGNGNKHIIDIINTDTTSFGTYEVIIDGFTITNGTVSSVASSSSGPATSITNGGGMYISYSLVTLTNCIVTGNKAYASATSTGGPATATARGGGLYAEWSDVTITNCAFTDNMAETAAQSTGYDASASSFGGALHLLESDPIITNCTFAGNLLSGSTIVYEWVPGIVSHTTTLGSGLYNSSSSPDITNCIVWDGISNSSGSAPSITYSNTMGGYPGIGNISTAPLFVDWPYDVSLSPDSPCIDAGTDTSGPAFGGVTDDILGVPRPQGTAYDMGAYEYRRSQPASPWSPVSIMPLARTQLNNTLVTWNELATQLPEEPTDEMTALIERIQEHMGNATGLANPIYASGELAKAYALMDELLELL
jgi:hypothetical protein